MHYSGIINCSIVDGTGFRVALYVSGCYHKCEGCHNRDTWNFLYGREFTKDVEEILFDRIDKPYIKGLTLTGGDPLYSSDSILPLIRRFREKFGDTKDIWLYTGFTMDEINHSDNENMKNVVSMCDYVVDGKFILSKQNSALVFRGSNNQIIWEKDDNGVFVQSKLN